MRRLRDPFDAKQEETVALTNVPLRRAAAHPLCRSHPLGRSHRLVESLRPDARLAKRHTG